MRPISPIFPAEMRSVASRRLPFAVMSPSSSVVKDAHVGRTPGSPFLIVPRPERGPFLIQQKLTQLFM